MSTTYKLDLRKEYPEPEMNELVQRLRGRFPHFISLDRTLHDDWWPLFVGLWVLSILVFASGGAMALLGGPAIIAMSSIPLIAGLAMLGGMTLFHPLMYFTFFADSAKVSRIVADKDYIRMDIDPGSGFCDIEKVHEIPHGFDKGVYALARERSTRVNRSVKTLKALGVEPKMQLLLTDKQAGKGALSKSKSQASGGEVSIAPWPPTSATVHDVIKAAKQVNFQNKMYDPGNAL